MVLEAEPAGIQLLLVEVAKAEAAPAALLLTVKVAEAEAALAALLLVVEAEAAGRGQQSRGIRLPVMAMTRRGGEEGVCAFPRSEWLRGGPWETARPIRTGLVMRSGGHVGVNTVLLAEEASVKQRAGGPG
ncbi:UNVERIFIED_CONTAM: hypothetical protein FKN15_019297 [Acipenser sinensis]